MTVSPPDLSTPDRAGPSADLTALRIGFVPLVDCAVLVVAQVLGFARAEGLALDLIRETSWATLRDRLMVGHFDAAHMLAPLPIAAHLGIGHVRVPMVAPLVLGLGGNSIAVSVALWRAMVEAHGGAPTGPVATGAALAQALARSRQGGAPVPTFAMTHPFSGHNYELRWWLAAAGIDPDQDVRLVVIPPPYMVDALKAGQIDGMCVGAPWPSLSVEAGVGRVVVSKQELWPDSPDKVLALRTGWAEAHPDTLDRLVRACVAAATWCADPANRAALAALLAEPAHVGVPADIIERALSGHLKVDPDGLWSTIPGYFTLPDGHALAPQPGHGLWYADAMLQWQQADDPIALRDAVAATWRPDLTARALGLAATPVTDPVATPVGAKRRL
jgi:NitT/TauT family transport system ATP-binding protein